MACFCKDSVSSLALMLPSLGLQASAAASLDVTAAAQVGELARLLLRIGMPWHPDPVWLQIKLPTLSLSANAMATLTAFAQLQATAMLLGLNLTTPVGARAFADLSASVAARLNALLKLGISLNPAPWAQMSAALQACAQIQAALKVNFLAPLNINVAVWGPFLGQLQMLLPVLTLMAQLNLTGNFSAQLSAALKVMLGIPMPTLPPLALSFMASLTATMTALAQIRMSLGVDPLQVGLPAIRLMVQERVQATVRLVENVLGMPFPAVLKLVAGLPMLPTVIGTPLNVRMAAALQLPPMNWNIPMMASLPVLSLGLPIAAFSAQLKTALNLPINLSPCMGGCDAAALLG